MDGSPGLPMDVDTVRPRDIDSPETSHCPPAYKESEGISTVVSGGSVAAQTPQPDLKALVADALAFADPSGNRMPEYEYTVRNRTKEFDSDGKLRKDDETIGIRTMQEGFFVFRIFEGTGRDSPMPRSREQEQKIRKRLDELKSASPEERERIRKKEAERNAWVKEVPDAFNFAYAGEEMLGNRKMMLVLCAPRPGYRPRNMRARVFETERKALDRQGRSGTSQSRRRNLRNGEYRNGRGRKNREGNPICPAPHEARRMATGWLSPRSSGSGPHHDVEIGAQRDLIDHVGFPANSHNGRRSWSGFATNTSLVHNESFRNSTRRRAGDANGQITSARKGRGQPKAIHAARRAADSRSYGPQVRCKPADSEIVIALRPEDIEWVRELLAAESQAKLIRLVEGGDSRQQSVENALAEIGADIDLVAVHDAVRPFVDAAIIERVISEASQTGAAIVGIVPIDTVKLAHLNKVRQTLTRERLVLTQTPQVFRTDLLKQAFEKAREDGFIGTDESSLVERLEQVEVSVVPGSDRNIKITRPNDMDLARLFLSLEAAERIAS